jgi:hypothetical protein
MLHQYLTIKELTDAVGNCYFSAISLKSVSFCLWVKHLVSAVAAFNKSLPTALPLQNVLTEFARSRF